MNSDPQTPVEHFVHRVYTIAHAASGQCGADHSDWLDGIDEKAKELKENKIMNLEKY